MIIVRDSSLYGSKVKSSLQNVYGDIKIGIVRSFEYDSTNDTHFYEVEVTHSSTKYILKCRQMSKFGDVYNFEEWGMRAASKASTNNKKPEMYKERVGEIVIVAHIGGNAFDGIILGTLRHPARKTKIKPDTLEYMSEFNGLMTHIGEDGSYKLMFQGKSLTSDALTYSAGGTPPQAQFNSLISGTYISIDGSGNLDLNDGGAMPQYVKVDKTNGKISITSGSIFVDLERNSGKISINSIDTEIKSSVSLKIQALNTSIDSSVDLKIKSAKIAIGFDGVELLDSIVQIVDAIGKLVVSSPVGPCSPVSTAPTWAELEAIKIKLSAIKGSL